MKSQITVQVRTAWWVKPYLFSVALFAWLTQSTPDLQKVMRTALRGISADVEGR